LKQKIQLEKQHKELKERLAQINKDKAKIWRGTKNAAKVGAGLYLGGSFLKSFTK